VTVRFRTHSRPGPIRAPAMPALTVPDAFGMSRFLRRRRQTRFLVYHKGIGASTLPWRAGAPTHLVGASAARPMARTRNGAAPKYRGRDPIGPGRVTTDA